MGKTGGDDRDGASCEHEKAEVSDKIADREAEDAAEEIAARDEGGGPQHRAEQVEHGKSTPAHRAETDGKGRDVSDSVDESEGENEPGVVALEPSQRRGDTTLPTCIAASQPCPILST